MKYYYKTIIFILAFCSIVYELILANTLAIITDNYIFWHSITIGIYILGLGVGSIRSDKKNKTIANFIHIELNLSLLGLLSVAYIYILYSLFNVNDFLLYIHNGFYTDAYIDASKKSLLLFALLSETLTFLIGFYSGFEIPFGSALDLQTNNNENENIILAINYIGTLVGTLIFSFLLYPKLDIILSSLVVATINFLVVITLIFKERKITLGQTTKMLSVVTIAVVIFQQQNWIQQFYLKTNYLTDWYIGKHQVDIHHLFRDISKIPEVQRFKTKYQYIDIYKTYVPEQTEMATVLTLNTHFQFSTHNEKFYHEAMSHLPINLLGISPKNILVLGGGDGLLIRELLKYKDSKITHIELDQDMIHLCKTTPWIAKQNQHSLENGRVHRIIGDGFYFLRNTNENFDLILIDFPYPDNYNLVKLYTYEFYTYVKKALTPDGAAILDAPLSNKINYLKPQFLNRVILSSTFDAEDNLYNTILMNTFEKAGFKLIFPYRVRKESFVILGRNTHKLNFDFNNFRHDLMPDLTEQDFYALQEQDFPYRKDPEMANSLFRPTFFQAINY